MAEHETTTPTFQERLSDLIQQGIERSKEVERQVLVSLTEEIEPVDPLTVFVNAGAFAPERWYWEQPSERTARLAIGVASATMPPRRRRYERSQELFNELIDQAVIDPPVGEDNPGPAFFSGFAFDPERKPDWRVWRGYSAASFLLPKASMVRQDGRCFMTYNCLVRPTSDPKLILTSTMDIYTRLTRALQREPDPLKYEVKIAPDEEDAAERMADEYRSAVTSATEAVRAGQFEKVVIARQREINATLAFHAPSALEKLRRNYPDCYIFAIGRQHSVFMGASPEQLVRLDGKQVSTVCLAGSIKRGETPEEDDELAKQLLTSEKDRHEHDVCVRAIREALEPLCSELDVPESPDVMTVSNVHHLRTPVRGTLANGCTLLQLVQQLHPTPAVGGYPKEEAIQFLRENEGFDRGWYGAPIGWLDTQGNGEFIVTLRSAVVGATRARLFAGCGIVAESDPDQELAELEVKLRPMLTALDGDEPDEDDEGDEEE